VVLNSSHVTSQGSSIAYHSPAFPIRFPGKLVRYLFWGNSLAVATI
jgi:hypothetical protein